MRVVVQRTLEASVTIDGEVVGRLEHPGLLVLLGVTHDDTPAEATWLAGKVWGLRLLRDERSLCDLADAGEPTDVLVVSQFTLYGDARKGRRPTWSAAAPGAVSEPLYEQFCAELTKLGARVARGVFGADMQVACINDGPVTLLLDSPGSRRN
ncbi:MAG: D-aminoacyl-tRNA deacylase [Nocardioidaceae bacterium]